MTMTRVIIFSSILESEKLFPSDAAVAFPQRIQGYHEHVSGDAESRTPTSDLIPELRIVPLDVPEHVIGHNNSLPTVGVLQDLEIVVRLDDLTGRDPSSFYPGQETGRAKGSRHLLLFRCHIESTAQKDGDVLMSQVQEIFECDEKSVNLEVLVTPEGIGNVGSIQNDRSELEGQV